MARDAARAPAAQSSSSDSFRYTIKCKRLSLQLRHSINPSAAVIRGVASTPAEPAPLSLLVIERLSLLAGDRKLGELADIRHKRELPPEFEEWLPEQKELNLETPPPTQRPPTQPRPMAPPSVRAFDGVMKGKD